jgi:hypothetical protein
VDPGVTPKEVKQEECRGCGYEGPHVVTETPNLTHWARLDCGKCHRWIRWLPKPDSDPTKYHRPAEHRDLVAKYGRGFCELCLRSGDELGDRNSLIGHHVIEYKNDGEPSRENTWILCQACHRLVTWVRNYHGGIASLSEVFKEWPQS